MCRKLPHSRVGHRLTWALIQHGPENAAKVGVEFEITVIEVSQAPIFPEQPRLRCPSTLEQLRRDRFRHLHFVRHGGRIR